MSSVEEDFEDSELVDILIGILSEFEASPG